MQSIHISCCNVFVCNVLFPPSINYFHPASPAPSWNFHPASLPFPPSIPTKNRALISQFWKHATTSLLTYYSRPTILDPSIFCICFLGKTQYKSCLLIRVVLKGPFHHGLNAWKGKIKWYSLHMFNLYEIYCVRWLISLANENHLLCRSSASDGQHTFTNIEASLLAFCQPYNFSEHWK